MSHKRASEKLSINPNQFDAILISSPKPNRDVQEKLTIIKKYAKNYINLQFDDIEFPRENYEMIDLKNLKEAGEFAKNKKELIVTCTAGVSRSSAIAYFLKTQEEGAEEAIKILDRNIHDPNRLVVKLASQIVNDPKFLTCLHEWRIN